MSAITISREAGSMGDWIADQTAQRLGYRLVDKNTFEHIFTQYGFVDFKETYNQTGFWARFDPHVNEMAVLLKQAIWALAVLGKVVLVGRGGFGGLKNYADVLNVRIQAPLPLRMRRVLDMQKVFDRAKAEQFIHESDRVQHDFLEAFYGSQWKSLDNFDLLINTGKISPQAAIDCLVEAGRHLGDNTRTGLPTTRELVTDPVMLDAVRHALEVFEA